MRILSLLAVLISFMSLYVACNNYKAVMARHRIVCLNYLDRFGPGDSDCARYEEEWKAGK